MKSTATILRSLLALMVTGAAMATQAQMSFVSQPMPSAGPKTSQAEDLRAYRVDGARHIYESYPHRIYRGKLPPLIHAIVVVETVLDEQGQAQAINIVREPTHAPDVTAAVREMIRRALPLPSPARMAGGVRYTETWLMDRSGRFQLDTLSEGQLDQ